LEVGTTGGEPYISWNRHGPRGYSQGSSVSWWFRSLCSCRLCLQLQVLNNEAGSTGANGAWSRHVHRRWSWPRPGWLFRRATPWKRDGVEIRIGAKHLCPVRDGTVVLVPELRAELLVLGRHQRPLPIGQAPARGAMALALMSHEHRREWSARPTAEGSSLQRVPGSRPSLCGVVHSTALLLESSERAGASVAMRAQNGAHWFRSNSGVDRVWDAAYACALENQTN
jgi:hypothetical protein